MFTRIVECQAKPGKQEELADKVRNEVLAILQRHPGFVDLITLRDNVDPERVVSLSFWRTREDAEHYHRNYYDRVSNILAPLVSSNPNVETFVVDDSTVHRIAARKAA
jgi:heme-degrading monooxygenase HmoA